MLNKPLAWTEIRRNAAAFAVEWAGASYEKGESQSFWAELFAVFGVRLRTVAKFEAQAKRLSGGTGFIDVFWPGTMIAEQKSTGKDLTAAETQAMNYLAHIPQAQMPRYVVTCDFATFRIRDLEAPGETPVAFALQDLPTECERLGFIAGYQKRTFGSAEQAAASVKAAQLMASLYDELEGSGYEEHQASIFLVRTLFALFADDSGLWERDLFLEYLQTRTSADGSDLGAQLAVLYQALNKPSAKRFRTDDELLQRFPYVNGTVFGETIEIPSFTSAMREKLIAACYFNWGQISPAIFGSLFQAVKSKDARRALGEHYTTEANILKVIEPLFLDELRQRFIDNQHSARGLRKLQQDMGRLRFLDPACGCGNFLIVAYRALRALELEILHRLQELDPASAQMVLDASQLLQVRMSSFYGIELEEWPATIARTAMFLVDHQANQDMALTLGLAPDMLPLVESSTILVGNALTTDWNHLMRASEDVYVFGNPPFLGHATRAPDQAAELRQVWGRNDIGRLDYVTGWYAKALDYYQGVPGGRWAFVSTNSIVQGEPVPALFGPVAAAQWRIRFAHRTFAWTSEAPGAAAVHCVIIGFDQDKAPAPRLFSYPDLRGAPAEQPAKTINGYLADAPHVLIDQRRTPLSPDLPKTVFGNMPRDGGHLLIAPEEHPEVRADPCAATYVRRFVGAKELLYDKDRWCLWLVDLDPADVARSPILKARLQAVRDFRAASTAASTRAMATTPHLFGQRSQPSVQYLCIPRHVGEDRRYFTVATLPPDVIVGDSNFEAPDPDGYLFGILSSSMFITWQKTVGGRLKSDLRFSNTLVWNNLPLPPVDHATRAKIIDAGHGILEARDLHPERSLAQHYHPLAMDPALLKAHDKLDAAVDRAFGARRTCTTEKQRQEILFARYADLAADEYRTVSK